MFELNRLESENEDQYKWRLYQAKAAGVIGLSWDQLRDKIDENIRPGEPHVDESVYRKEAAVLNRFYSSVLVQSLDKEQSALLEEIKKERVKLRDERTDINRQIRSLARTEQQMDYLLDTVEAQGKERYRSKVTDDMMKSPSKKQMIVMLSDMHIGACFDNQFGRYDSDIAQKRLTEYAEQIRYHTMLYGCNRARVVLLGDMCSGIIHNSLRVTNRENVIEQIMKASNLIGDFLYELSGFFDYIAVSNVSGNHTRIEKKEDALKDERLDALLPFILKNRLSHLQYIHFSDSIDTTLDAMKICDKTWVAVHGDMDEIGRDGIAKIITMLGYVPYGIMMGHGHHAEYRVVNGVHVVMGGCLSGAGDDYTISKRLTGSPSQTMMVCDDHGIVAHIPIEFKE